ncbi:uncharacterized protein ACN427_010889 [Glossina fuscipes fuscipes]
MFSTTNKKKQRNKKLEETEEKTANIENKRGESSDRDNSFVSISNTNNVNNSIGSRSLNGLIRNEQSWEEVTIVVPWGTIQGKWWGSRNKQPILALDGWQDNCGTVMSIDARRIARTLY